MGIQDVAKAISKVGALDFSGIGKAMSLNADNINQVAKNVATREAVALRAERDALKKSMKGMKAGSQELADATTRLGELRSQITGLQGAYKTGTVDSVNAALKDVTGKDKMGYMRFAQGYFGDKTYGGTRIKTTLGAGAAAAVGIRYLSGGNLTTNARGEHDIAGIPFI
jgi:hypothetical protein